MSIPGLTADELTNLRAYLVAAIETPCIADWEFDSLVGSTRAEARSWVEGDLAHVAYDEGLLDQMAALLSMLAGSQRLGRKARRLDACRLERLIEKLFWAAEDRTEHQSSVTLRSDLLATTRSKPARKRSA